MFYPVLVLDKTAESIIVSKESLTDEELLMDMKYILAKMTWPEVEELLKETDIALVPVGSTEQHGPALPVDNDAYIALNAMAAS
ncbi:MAG: hypothetical protein ThorAB25_23550 [Candidatus Thorarchaeota archaeon AB_25]|nr:MAG: hypothetical protein ThorAB25_23550 [Candidatus Thorarchaeota archaeon AB_25]